MTPPDRGEQERPEAEEEEAEEEEEEAGRAQRRRDGAAERDDRQPSQARLGPEHSQQRLLSLTRPPTIKPSRSLSIIVGDHQLAGQQHLLGAGNHGIGSGGGGSGSGAGAGADNCSGQCQAASALSQLKAGGRLSSKFGHQLQSQYSMPCSLNSRRQTQHTYQIHHSLLDEQIIYSELSIVAKKDFAEEVRALLDIRKFVTDSFILTDVAEVRIETIVETIIDRLVECRQLGHQVREEAKTLLFLERGSLSMVLANTMQGLYKSRSDGRLAYDHSWIVAASSLSGLQKRQVAITRFAQPVNFGRQSQEVRFLIIVLAPSKEKLTKSAWETGRTFATMFTDIEFRRRLLKAKSQEEIKVELLVRAETLAREAASTPAPAPAGEGQLQLRLQLQRQQAELDCRLALRLDESGRLAGAKQQQQQQQQPPLPMNSIDLFDTKLLQLRQAELDRKREQLRAQRLQSAGADKKRPSASSASSSASSGKHFHEAGPGDGGAAGCGCLPDELARPLGRLASGLLDDLKRRSKFYLSDFTDGILGERSLYKTISTTIFLYFSVLLPCIAFGVVDTNNTDGAIDPKKTMIGQALGGLFFALFSGQPLVVVMTTAPLCIYVKLIYQISQDLEVDFGSFYACVGLWMAFFLFIMSITNSSNLMRYCTRSTEDIFALFTAFAFGSDGIKEAIRSFQKYYWEPDCLAGAPTSQQQQQQQHHHHQHVLVSRAFQETQNSSPTAAGSARQPAGPSLLQALTGAAALGDQHHLTEQPVGPMHEYHHQAGATAGLGLGSSSGSAAGAGAGLEAGVSLFSRCQRESCILFLFLMCGTLWLANSFNSFDRTPYLSSRKREIIKDYALAISVLIFSFIGSYLFSEIRLDVFEFSEFSGLHLAQLGQLAWPVWATAGLLGFMASVLFYIDQNICGAMVNNAPYKLKKGNYFHLDLLVLALLNTFLSLTGLPWMHGKLPHSHLHSKALADYEERVDEGHVHQIIVNIRETRLTGILVGLLVALSLLAVPYPLSYIPLPVLSGVFLYTALAEFKSNSMVERVCLLFTEQVAYPPNHYIRRCPQRKIHLFTLAQIVQLAIVSLIGFYPNPYVNMAFPLAVATFVPVRELLLPKLIDAKYLHSLDSASLE